MNPTDPTSAREEAERLVATVLATVSSGSLFGAAPGPVSTGSAECCVCPVCRAIAAMREPNPEFAERVATGAGDFAAGVASLLRSLSTPAPSGSQSATPPYGSPDSGPESATSDSGSRDDGEDVWRAATRASHDPGPG
jgi:hypothetical protein